jgi:hypothetical protein
MNSTNSDVMEAVVRSLCVSIDSPRALSVWLCYKYDQEELLRLPMTDPAQDDSVAFQKDYFITEYLSKYKGLKTSIDTRKVAIDSWRAAEDRCKATNAVFRGLQHRPIVGRANRALFGAQRKIAAVLGSLQLPLIFDQCKWGPGATYDLRRSGASLDKKISQALSVTAEALPYIRAVLEADPHWAAVHLGVMPWGPYSVLPQSFKIVRGSRFLTVPKSAKTDRNIAAEPTANAFLQQGVHVYMRRRLSRFGISLDDQSINQRKAQDAFFAGLSTLDLSAASDSIARELIFHLLPVDWALFLDLLRSKETFLDGEWIRTEKFASMGNAFIFDLETLIFWALASSVDEVSSVDQVTVYGDDIIVPREAFESVVEILTLCGFSINSKKSFKDGNFFESCGKHYHKGLEVTPVYQKEPVKDPSELIRAHNRLCRLQARITGDWNGYLVRGATRALTKSWSLRPFPRIPYGAVEDGGFLRPLSEFTRDRNHGFKCQVYDYVPRLTEAREDALYAYKLRRFVQQNPTSKGYAGTAVQGKWRSKTRWIPEHNVVSKDTTA